MLPRKYINRYVYHLFLGNRYVGDGRTQPLIWLLPSSAAYDNLWTLLGSSPESAPVQYGTGIAQDETDLEITTVPFPLEA